MSQVPDRIEAETPANSQVIGNSEMYTSESYRDNGIDSVMPNAPTAKVVEIAASA